MRAHVKLVLLAVCCLGWSCRDFDPVSRIPHREFPSTQAAISTILTEAGSTQLYAIGEYHVTRPAAVASPFARFVAEVLPALDPVQHIVLEVWPDPSCFPDDPVTAQIDAILRRPQAAPMDLVQAAQRRGLHGLSISCIEHWSMRDPRGDVDFHRLLAMIGDKLLTASRDLVASGDRVITYGGAVHNDLYPRWLLEDVAYGHTLARQFDVLEIDLAVPEVVEPMTWLRHEPWYPLLRRAAPDRTLVWQRGPSSYVVILSSASPMPST